jgi:ZIP family zinc transporter
MLEAGFWGLIAASSLLVGALIAFAVRVPDRVLGVVLAFGGGALVSAVAYELVADAIATSEPSPLIALGFAAGALVFFLGSVAISRMGAAGSADDGSMSRRGREQGAQIVLGAVLDGIPESVVLGLTLIGGGIDVAVLAAVFISNVPEALGASADLAASGVSRGRVISLWVIVVLASGLAAAIGYAALRSAQAEVVSTVQTFAAGAIIAMLAESMFPEAYEKGGRAVGLATAFGFATSAALSFTA